ncbi:hypothetical protein [Pseudaquabacterium pictum]|uniref:Lipoprotein n=1 Tax=Pseudaquabacterium pictum TaxID=2315236 RepID=A0A480AMD7_9BURK|nr:hypothetical protein [Rubrivivax pictus]GCL62176.1 hypothetical protein AQPW35_12570 [Rubrivivax pictus]
MPRRLRPLALLWASLAGAAPVLAACEPPAWAWQAGAEHSRWQEHADNGRRLLTEQGTLTTAETRATLDCSGLQWQATLGLASGRRGYQGESNGGQPISTHSDIRRLHWQAAALWPLSAWGPGWQAGAALGQVRLWRDIASAGPVLGYPERFDQWHATALLAHGRLLRPGLGLQARLALGGGTPGRMALWLPTADPARLRLGSHQVMQLDLALVGGGAAEAAGWRLGLRWRHQRTAAGPAATLWRGNLPVGAAAQPAIRQTDAGLQAGWQW